MNQRNADALFSILGWDANAAFSRIIRDDVTAAETMEFAKALAACGVLVPAALTDEECDSAQETGFLDQDLPAAEFRDRLAEIARGEAGGLWVQRGEDRRKGGRRAGD